MDPRVERTREHVLNCTRALLTAGGPEAVTFSSVGKAARVARQTLYSHWTTREQLIADVLVVTRCRENPLPVEATPQDHLRAFLVNVRDAINAPAIAGASAMLMSHATADPTSAATLKAMTDERMDSLRAGWGPLSEDDYAMITGPVLFQLLVMRMPVTDEFISAVVSEAMSRRPEAAHMSTWSSELESPIC